MKASASCGATPAFCGSSPVLSWTNSSTSAFCDGSSLPSASAQAVAIDRMDGVEQRHRFLGLVGLQRPDQMQLGAGIARRSAGHFALASCTRFSPKTRCPACQHRHDRLGRRRSSTPRSASPRRARAGRRAQARAISCSTAASPLDAAHSSHHSGKCRADSPGKRDYPANCVVSQCLSTFVMYGFDQILTSSRKGF